VLTGAACLVLELEPLIAHSAHASEHHIATLTLSLRLMVSVRFRIASRIAGMTDAATVSAVMSELAARRWRGHLPTRLARELVPRVDELPEVERRQLLDALTRRAEGGQL
jgi:hypothetical protein